MPNRLAESLSPYLLQHQNNPVDWFPWCNEAFQLAKKLDRPIFLSVGYAACHWCHVMEHESFENEAIAEFLNNYFISVKVDREERPDVDQIYMNAVQVMSGRGGWPMSVFLDHDRRPFYAGTYWPPTQRAGMPGFAQVLDAIAAAWQDRRDEVVHHADQITAALTQLAKGTGDSVDQPADDVELARRIVRQACDQLVRVLDRNDGGFGGAPKFPHATDLLLLLSQVAVKPNVDYRGACELTLNKMAAGGIFDHIGGGFARYSVDSKWLVPHFEKMLYDNALLATTYTRGFQVTGSGHFAAVADATLRYMARDMVDPSGGLHCSEDADSEGVEGKFYVWKPGQVTAVLGKDRSDRFAQIYDITDAGNFEGTSIPNRLHATDPNAWDLEPQALETQLAADRESLRQARQKRVRPGRDDKIITAWNALAIDAFAVAGAVFDSQEWIDVATKAGQFLCSRMRRDDGRLLHAFRAGTAHLDAYVDDYALTASAFVTLYQVTADKTWIDTANQLVDSMIEHFWDDTEGGFYYTADDSETLITRNKDWHDGSLVSGNGAAVNVLLTLADLTGNDRYRQHAQRTLNTAAEILQSQSAAAASLVIELDRLHRGNRQMVLAVPSKSDVPAWRGKLFAKHRSHTTLAWHLGDADNVALADQKSCVDGRPTLYVCEDFTCGQPLTADSVVSALAE
ncbi:thioredoxin domain-containing protein [Crateriforma conspicua]|uniref:thioredoxin domain-containing protein n=1 Tax=Crateriforma conspicua TaxID=2527996 RepID=UPI00118A09C3|nr:thioredoxin domain-containing protein [Crateriforma conspicua]QDV61256.1 N-acylglucosamine 2-epimerase (GlcNAc 2-epimerase) [Crateriforma conspicua]